MPTASDFHGSLRPSGKDTCVQEAGGWEHTHHHSQGPCVGFLLPVSTALRSAKSQVPVPAGVNS